MDAETLGGELRLDTCLHPVSCASFPKLTQRVWARIQCLLYTWPRCPLGWESIYLLFCLTSDVCTAFPIWGFVFHKFFWLLGKKWMPTKSDLNNSSCFLTSINTSWSSLIVGLFLPHVHFACLLMERRSFTESEKLRPERTLRIGNVWLHADIFLLLRASPWLNAFPLPLPNVLFTLRLAYKIKPKLLAWPTPFSYLPDLSSFIHSMT